LPEAALTKVAVAPALAVVSVGCVVMTGAYSTVRVAAEVGVASVLLVKTARY
jgi:hypothetical protein